MLLRKLAVYALLISLCFLILFPSNLNAQLSPIPTDSPTLLFGGGKRSLNVTWRNEGAKPIESDLRFRIIQATSVSAVVFQEPKPWKKLKIQAGQTVLEKLSLDLPEVRGITRFVVQYIDGANKIVGSSETRVYPSNILAEVFTLAGENGLGVLDPEGNLKSALTTSEGEFEDLEESGLDQFGGALIIVGPIDPKSDRADSLSQSIKARARSGTAVVWIQSPSPDKPKLTPSAWLTRVGNGVVLIADNDTVHDATNRPLSQLNLVKLSRWALRPNEMELPR